MVGAVWANAEWKEDLDEEAKKCDGGQNLV
jgi:hypothetical protein